MLRLVLFLLAVSALAFGVSWLADRPGSLIVHWQGYAVETSVFRAIVILAVLVGLAVVLWSVLRQIWNSPAAIGRFFNRRRQKRGLEALSSGMIAIGAGDRALATRYAIQARKSLPNEPLTHLLRAQAAQLSGDRTTSRRIFEAMLGTPDTEQLGLRGLFLEAEREGEQEAARQFAKRAMALNPALGWPVEALFDIQCRNGNWAGALGTLAVAKRHHHVERAVADRRRAVLLTAQAQVLEETDPDRAMNLAREAHSLAPDLVPAAAIAGRILAAKGHIRRAAKILQRTWKRSPHPDIAVAYAHARIGDSPRDRLDRVKQLAALRPHSMESAIAVATAAIEAQDWPTARHVLQPLIANAPTQRACTLMARIEAEQHGDRGRVREWLARAVTAPRDPAWTADGLVSERWAPTSPVTGALDAFQWRVPVEAMGAPEAALLSEKLEELVQLGPQPEPALAHSPVIEAHPAAPAREEARAAAEIVEEVEPAEEETPTTRSPQEPDGAEGAKSRPAGSAADAQKAKPTTASPELKESAKPAGEPASAEMSKSSPDRATQSAPAKAAPKQPPEAAAAAKAAPPADARSAAPDATAAPSAAKAQPQPFRTRTRPVEPRIFVPPRAPDDPGPDGGDSEENTRGARLGFQLPMKGSA